MQGAWVICLSRAGAAAVAAPAVPGVASIGSAPSAEREGDEEPTVVARLGRRMVEWMRGGGRPR